MSRVTINQGAINRFFERSPVAGAGLPGLSTGTAERVALRMIAFVRREIAATFQERSGDLASSLHPIIRPDPRGGVRVGVGSTAPYAGHLEDGTRAHPIGPRPLRGGKPQYLVSRPDHPESSRLRGRRLKVQHPGNRAYGFLRKGVNAAIGRPTL